ncbi:MAG: hypothetical protein WD206_00140 [Actinomycetota bacterium]
MPDEQGITRREAFRRLGAGAAGLTAARLLTDLGPTAEIADAYPRDGKIILGAYAGPWPGDRRYPVHREKAWSTYRNSVTTLEDRTGRRLGMHRIFYQWDHPWPTDYDRWSASPTNDGRRGRKLFLSWNAVESSGGRTRYIPWSRIAQGHHDDRIRHRARGVLDFYRRMAAKGSDATKRMYLCFNHECEGAVSKQHNGNAEEFKRAWWRIHKIFRQEGAADKVYWSWTVTAWGLENGHAAKYYPGKDFVDRVAVTGYNWDKCEADRKWRWMGEIIRPSYDWARRRGKKLIVAEWGTTESVPGRPSKAEWIANARKTFKSDRWKGLEALLYYNSDSDCNWWVYSSSSAEKAWRAMATDRYYR